MRKHKLKINGREVTPEEFHRKRLQGTGTIARSGYSEARPLKSIALSCHPDQVEESRAVAKAYGIVGIDWAPDGTCLITSRRARARWLHEVKGLHDNDGGYGDG